MGPPFCYEHVISPGILVAGSAVEPMGPSSSPGSLVVGSVVESVGPTFCRDHGQLQTPGKSSTEHGNQSLREVLHLREKEKNIG